MNSIIKKYLDLITIQDINKFALKNDIELTNKELNIIYLNIKNNFDEILKDTNDFLFKISDQLTKENSIKIYKLLEEYKKRYKNYL